MTCLRRLIVFVLLGLVKLTYGKDGDELKAVVVLFRHGDRAPLSSWPNDPYFGDPSLWPDGYGQLNNLGKERHYLLGQWLRERYDGFLPKRYNRSDIYVRSTDVDRTLMSAASNLAGLYPPQDDQVWNVNIPWQAIPIHTVPEDQDPILAAEIPCPKHERLTKELFDSKELQQIDEELQDLFKNISQVTGYGVDELDVTSFAGLFSTITIYKGLNLTLPSWTEYYWPEIKEWGAKKFQWPTFTTDMARLRTGPFFDYLLSYFNNVVNNELLPTNHIKGPRHLDFKIADSAVAKFLMLSAHDTTIADRTNAMGVFPDAVPEFGSSVIWEVKQGGNDFYVNIYFKNSTSFDKMVMPGCRFDCGLEDFARILKPVTATVEEWRRECNEG